jgi:2-polyprenyl-3-methyl-5-hydroxy-6-metoxy-1,4-benzoquinol methylase
MSRLIEDVEADRELKSKHKAMWSMGDYPAVAAEVIPATGPRLVEACGVHAGQRVLDVGAGSGNAAIPAALTGAQVVASDLAPSCSRSAAAAPRPRVRPSSGRRPTPRPCRTPTASSTS